MQIRTAFLQLQINLHIQYIYILKRYFVFNRVLISNDNDCKIALAFIVLNQTIYKSCERKLKLLCLLSTNLEYFWIKRQTRQLIVEDEDLVYC